MTSPTTALTEIAVGVFIFGSLEMLGSLLGARKHKKIGKLAIIWYNIDMGVMS